MDEYIKRNSFLTDTLKRHCTNCSRRKNANGKMVYAIGDAPCRACGIGDMLDAVEDYPAADVRQNVRGDWFYQNPLFIDTIMCSVCGYNLPSDEFKTNFCPNCGADMRGAKK